MSTLLPAPLIVNTYGICIINQERNPGYINFLDNNSSFERYNFSKVNTYDALSLSYTDL